MGISWRIAKIGRLSIRIDGSWVIIFALVTWSLAVSYFPQQYRGWSPVLYWSLGLLRRSDVVNAVRMRQELT